MYQTYFLLVFQNFNCAALVDPGKIDIPIVRYAGPLKQRVSSKSKPNKLGENINMLLRYLFFFNKFLSFFSELISVCC